MCTTCPQIGNPTQADLAYYADSAVVAYKLPENDVAIEDLKPTVTTSAGTIEAAALSDGDYVNGVTISRCRDRPEILDPVRLLQARSIQAVTMVMGGGYDFMQMFTGWGESNRDLEASEDGQTWRNVVHIPSAALPAHTIAFPPASARFFRVTFR